MNQLGPEADSPAESFCRWFEYYWGGDEIHTVIFDFDDTLAYTGGLQIQAWIDTIEEALRKGDIDASKLSRSLREYVSDDRIVEPKLFEVEIVRLFNELQLAQEIVRGVFEGVPELLLEDLKKRRFERRSKLMEGKELFPGAVRCLKDLATRHRLAIVSSTEESLIREFLAANNVGDHIGQILGKTDPGLHESRTIEDKAYLFLKLSVLTGVPLSRMVYVGDNRLDFASTRQVGLSFVENLQAAKKRGLESLIAGRGDRPRPDRSFTDFNDLPDILTQISKEKWKTKWK